MLAANAVIAAWTAMSAAVIAFLARRGMRAVDRRRRTADAQSESCKVVCTVRYCPRSF